MIPRFDRPTFFNYVRRAPFGNRLTQSQVDGLTVILDLWEAKFRTGDIRHLAYILATAFHETGGRMEPVREGFAATDAQARKVVAKRKYGKPDPHTGHVYYGRGYVQLTHAENYMRIGVILGMGDRLYQNPDLVLSPTLSANILMEGMLRGVSSKGDFTGKALEDYFNSTVNDPIGARRVVNGTDKAQLIATYHAAFLASLEAALEAAENGDRPDDVTPEGASPDGTKLSKDPIAWGGIISGAGGIASSLFASLNNPYALAFAVLVGVGLWLIATGRVRIIRNAGA